MLTWLNEARHTAFHSALRAFLAKNYPKMLHSAGYGAKQITATISGEDRIRAMVQFYRQYKDGAYFYAFIDELKRTIKAGRFIW